MIKYLFSAWPVGVMRRVQVVVNRLLAMEIWLVALFVAASVVSPRLLPWALAVAGLFWAMRLLACGHVSVRTPADAPIALLGLMIPVTLWTTALPEVTLQSVCRLLTGIALYYAILNWATSPARLRVITTGSVLAGFLLAMAALVSVRWTINGTLSPTLRSIYASLPTLVSDTVNPNVMAGALLILVPPPLALLVFDWQELGGREMALVSTAVLAMLGVLVLTQSRGGLMGLGVVLITMAAMRWRLGWLTVAGGAVAGVLAIKWLGIAVILDALTANNTLGGLDIRLEVWSRALYMIQDFPFTGIGMGSFQEVAKVLYPFFKTSQEIPHAHNLFLQVAVDLGIPGLIAWLAIWMIAVAGAWSVYRRGRLVHDNRLSGLGAGFLCSQVALVVHGTVDAVTWGAVRSAVITWLIWALIVASWQTSRPQPELGGRE